MSRIYFGIASYQRAGEQRTLELLKRLGVPRNDIILSVQTESDHDAYKKYESDATLIYREAHNAAGNRNNILDWLPRGEHLVMLDDDISEFCYLKGEKLEAIDTPEKFQSFLRVGFSVANKMHAPGFSLYPVCNGFFMSHSFINSSMAIGTFIATIVTTVRYDTDFDVKEDYEFTCQNIKRFGAFPRLNNFACKAQHYTKGGCSKWWDDGMTNGNCAKKLCERYPQFVKMNKARPGEVKTNFHPVKTPYHWKYEKGEPGTNG